ncbi:MAG: redoxin domain-containing protein [Candidatus Cyclobacteriaceae bacterium M2_1C_046]
MYRTIYTFLIFLIVHAANSQSILDINFNSIKTGKVILINSTNNRFDTVNIEGGNFSYYNRINHPTLYSLIINGFNDSRPINFILSNEKTEIVFDNFKQVIESQNIKDIYPNLPHFTKDPNNNQAFYKFHSEWMIFYDKIKKFSTSDSNELLEKRKEVYHSFLKQCEAIIKNNKDKYVSAVIIDYLLKNNLLPLETIQAFYDYLEPSVKNSFFGIRIGEYAGKAGKLSPGNPAPEFELYDINNQKYNLKNFKGKKKILLHFWSSSCAPCIKEAPDLIRFSKENEDNLIVINISLDTDESKWKKGIERAAIGKMNNVCDFNGVRSKIAQDYAIKVVPTYYLIDENGKIIIKGSLNQIEESVL